MRRLWSLRCGGQPTAATSRSSPLMRRASLSSRVLLVLASATGMYSMQYAIQPPGLPITHYLAYGIVSCPALAQGPFVPCGKVVKVHAFAFQVGVRPDSLSAALALEACHRR